MNLRKHLKQTVTLRRRGQRNDANEIEYADPEEIPAMFEPDSGLRRSATGEDVTAESYLMTVDKIDLGDQISGSVQLQDGTTFEIPPAEIRRVTPVMFKGKAIGFEARL